MHWRRKWQPTPVFLPGESQGRGSLVGCRLRSHRVGHDWRDSAAAAAAMFTYFLGSQHSFTSKNCFSVSILPLPDKQNPFGPYVGCKKETPEDTFLVCVIFFSVDSQRARAGRDLWFDTVWFRSSDKGGNWGLEKGRNQSRGAHSGGRAALSILETDTALGLVSMKWFNKWGLMAYKIIERTRAAKVSRSCWHRVLLLSCQTIWNCRKLPPMIMVACSKETSGL